MSPSLHNRIRKSHNAQAPDRFLSGFNLVGGLRVFPFCAGKTPTSFSKGPRRKGKHGDRTHQSTRLRLHHRRRLLDGPHRQARQHARRVRVEDRVHVHAALRGAARVRRRRLLAGDAAARAARLRLRLRRISDHLRHHPAHQARRPRVLPAQRLRIQPGLLRAAVRAGHLLAHHGRGHLPLRRRQRVHDGRRLLCAHRPDRRRRAHPASCALRRKAPVLKPAVRYVPADHPAVGSGGSPACRAGGVHRAHRQRQLVSGHVHAGAHDELLRLA